MGAHNSSALPHKKSCLRRCHVFTGCWFLFFLNRLLLPPGDTLNSTVHGVKIAMKRCDTWFFSAFCGCDQSHALFHCSQLSPLSSHYNFSLFLVPFTVSTSGFHMTPSAELEELLGHWVGVVERGDSGLGQQFGVAKSHPSMQENSTGPLCLSNALGCTQI